MPTVAVTSRGKPAPRDADGHPRAYLQAASGRRLFLTWAPVGLDDTGGQSVYATTAVAGGLPAIRPTAGGLRTLSLTATVGVKRRGNIEGWLKAWRDLVASGQRVHVGGLGPTSRGWWYITDQTVSPTSRNPSNWIAMADIAITLTQAHDPRPKIGSTSTRGKNRHQQRRHGTPAKKPDQSKWRTYTVRAGDTLFGIATRVYGDGRKWKKIASANRLKTTVIHPGQRLRIPPQ